MDVAVQDGATADALEQLRRRTSAEALELVVDETIVAVAGVASQDAPLTETLHGGVVVRRWGGRPPEPHEAVELLAQALSITLRNLARSDDARASAAAFLGTTTHEVKTPLTVVLGTIRLMQQHGGSVDAEQRTLLLSMAARRTRDVARLVDGVLHTARSQLTPDVPRRAELRNMVEEATSGVEFGADVEVGALPDVSIAVDAATGRSVLGSLLDDALTRGGSVSLAGIQHPDCVEITVRNTQRSVESLRDDPAFEPAAPGEGTPSATAGLHLAALLCEASSATLDGGVVGQDACFVVRFPTV